MSCNRFVLSSIYIKLHNPERFITSKPFYKRKIIFLAKVGPAEWAKKLRWRFKLTGLRRDAGVHMHVRQEPLTARPQPHRRRQSPALPLRTSMSSVATYASIGSKRQPASAHEQDGPGAAPLSRHKGVGLRWNHGCQDRDSGRGIGSYIPRS